MQERPRLVAVGDVLTIPSSTARSKTAAYKVVALKPVLIAGGGGGRSNSSNDVVGMVVDKTTAVFEKRAAPSRMPPALALEAAGIGASIGAGAGAGSSSVPQGTHDADMNGVAQLPVEAQLREILAACFSPASLHLGLKHPVLLHGPRGAGKLVAVKAACRSIGVHVHVVSGYELRGDTLRRTESRIAEAFKQAGAFHPCVLLIRHLHAIAMAGQDGNDAEEDHVGGILAKYLSGGGASNSGGGGASNSGGSGNNNRGKSAGLPSSATSAEGETANGPCLVVGTTDKPPSELPSRFVGSFVHVIHVDSPSEADRATLIEQVLKRVVHDVDNVTPASIARQTAGCTPRDLQVLLRQAGRVARQRVNAAAATSAATDGGVPAAVVVPAAHAGGGAVTAAVAVVAKKKMITMDDVDAAIGLIHKRQATLMGAPKIPQVSWEDVGGLAGAKDEILDTIQLPLQHPELVAKGLQRSGVLLYGPPGTGKTLLAKAVATECALNFFSVKGPELINPYVGQSEANIRAVFEKARSARPCVVFFDELDSLAPNRGRTGDSGGVMDRIVSQLLAELDGLHSGNDVFIIGATNRPDLIDPGLLRPGRLDRMIYLSAPDKEDQRRIFLALTRKYDLHPDFDVDVVLAQCSTTFTGADLYALCSDAMLNAVRRSIDEIEAKRARSDGGGGSNDDSDSDSDGDGDDGGGGGGNTVTADAAATEPPYVKEKQKKAQVLVTTSDFVEALSNLTPSVTQEQMKHYESLHAQFSPDA